jgi:hypothetical protein
VYQYVVPGPVFRRPAQCDLLVPFFRARKFRIDIDDDTAVIEFNMVDALSDEKLRL